MSTYMARPVAPDGRDPYPSLPPYGRSKADAVRAFRDGFPALLPRSNPWRSIVEAHRYGEHGPHAGPDDRCPICPREDSRLTS